MILSILFDRLYVLRNQLVHGGATWNSDVNPTRFGTEHLRWDVCFRSSSI